jgi:aryl-alcohol dehydrogenase-like predicted oxidoreductase
MSLDVKSIKSELLLKQAFDSGITFYDTADLYQYGENEKLIGRALKEVRNKVIIATKVGNEWTDTHSNWRWNPTKKYILHAVEESLKRLNTEYIDLYQLHGGTIDDPIDESIEAFEILKEQGKIREYGISSIRPNVIRKWLDNSNMVSVMMQYSIFDRRPEEEMIDALMQKNVSMIARGTLSKGLLVGRNAKAYLGYSKHQVERLQLELSTLGNELSSSIQFVLNQPIIASALVGIRTPKQLESIISASYVNISESKLARLSNMLPLLNYENHR